MGTYHVLATCMLLYVSLTCNLMQNYYTQKKTMLSSYYRSNVITTHSFVSLQAVYDKIRSILDDIFTSVATPSYTELINTLIQLSDSVNSSTQQLQTTV